MTAAAQKAPDAFRTISEAASEVDAPQHVLRFWESKFSAIKPLKRGGGRRYYRPDDIDLLRGIKTLLYRDGLTIKGVQKILREQGARMVMELGRGETQLLKVQRHVALVETGVRDEIPPSAAGEDIRSRKDENSTLTPIADAPDRAHFERLLDELMHLKSRLKKRE
jgi:DNA-binding transcriptional MerR regulator